MSETAEPNPSIPAPPLEGPAWRSIDGIWKRIYGDFTDKGVSIEWHEFSNANTIDWAQSFHPLSLEICLNFSGRATLQQDKNVVPVDPEKVAIYITGNHPITAKRTSGHLHRFFTIELSPEYLRDQFVGVMSTLKPGIRNFLEHPEQAGVIVEVMDMPVHLLNYRLYLLEPPVASSARDIWYQSKITEILSHTLFVSDAQTELFCHRYKRLNQERCERARYLLERDLENPPSLSMLAKEVQCSSSYLSRIFVQHVGSSIPRYIRIQRLEKAGELLRVGTMNVTEVAMKVGYSSISSFNKAFGEHFGCSPSLYPNARKQG